MRDYGVSVLEQYPIEIRNVRRVRGAMLCETDQGLLLLKEAEIRGKRLPFLIELYQHLMRAGVERIDVFLANKEGEYISVAEDETKYILKRWYEGHECDLTNENEVLSCVRSLAKLHKVLVMPKSDEAQVHERSIGEEYARHNRELRKVYAFVKKRSVKSSFEQEFLNGYDQMYYYAEMAEKRLANSNYVQYEETRDDKTIVHGDYNYHNLLFSDKGLAITGFERAHYGLQLEDLYYFMRKILEKYQYDEEMGSRMLEAYDSILPLDKAKMEYLALRFAYPEKFWKTANLYYHSNKAWIPEKTTEKLRKSIAQTEEKRRFLEHLFALDIV